jgi:hypothetical protein
MAIFESRVYKNELNQFSFEPREITIYTHGIDDYIAEIDPDYSPSSKKSYKQRRRRVGKNSEYLTWRENHRKTVVSQYAGTVHIEYDGQIPLPSIRMVILESLSKGVKKIKYCPSSNRNRRPEDMLVYIKEFEFNV